MEDDSTLDVVQQRVKVVRVVQPLIEMLAIPAALGEDPVDPLVEEYQVLMFLTLVIQLCNTFEGAPAGGELDVFAGEGGLRGCGSITFEERTSTRRSVSLELVLLAVVVLHLENDSK